MGILQVSMAFKPFFDLTQNEKSFMVIRPQYIQTYVTETFYGRILQLFFCIYFSILVFFLNENVTHPLIT